MEQRDLLLLEKFAESDPELKEVWNDHILYEKQVEKLEGRTLRTPLEDQTLKQLKKQKLEGKTRLDVMLEKYRGMA